MLKRTLAMLLAVVMILGMCPVNAFATDGTETVSDSTDVPDTTDTPSAGDEGVGDWGIWEHSPYGNGTVITAYLGEDYDVTVPETIDGYPVTAIGSRAFMRVAIGTLNLPSTVTAIESQAFYRGSIEYICFDGTAAQWAALRENTATGNDAFLAADYYCMRKDALKLDEDTTVTIAAWEQAEYSFEVPQSGIYQIKTTGTENGDGGYYYCYSNLASHTDATGKDYYGYFYAEAGQVLSVFISNDESVEQTTTVTLSKLTVLLPGESITQEIAGYSGYYYAVELTNTGKYALQTSHEQVNSWDTQIYTNFYNVTTWRGSMEAVMGKDVDRSRYQGYQVEESTVALCRIYNQYDQPLTVRTAVLSVPDATGLAFRQDYMEGKLGFTYYINVDMDPVYSWTELEFVSGDESIVKVTEQYKDGCYVELVGGGETTLTVTAPDGLTDTMTIFVDTPEELELGVPSETVTLTRNGDEEQYVFTVPESGIYYFRFPMTYTEESGWYEPGLSCSREDGSVETVRDLYAYEEGNRYVFYALEAGDVVTLTLTNYSSWLEMQACMTVNRADAPQSITCDTDKLLGRAEEEFWLNVSYQPNTAYAEMSYSLEDADIASVERNGNELYIRLLQVGETTLTVSFGDVTRQIPVICWEPQAMEPAVTYEKTLETGGSFEYTFTPAETGIYCFAAAYEEIDGSRYAAEVQLQDKQYLLVEIRDVDGRNVHYYQLEGGQEYTFILSNYNARTLNTSATVFPEPKVETIHWNVEVISGKVDEYVSVQVQSWAPAEARLGDLFFEIDNTNVARISYSGSRNVSIQLLDGGEATLSAKGDGFTVMLPIAVEGLPQVKLNETVSATLETWQRATWEFAAEVSGFYTFSCPQIITGNSGYTCEVYVESPAGEGWYEVDNGWGNGTYRTCWIEAGTKVRASLDNSYGVELTPSLTVTATPAGEEVSMGDLDILLGGSTRYTPSVSPSGTWSKLSFSVDNENIAKIVSSNYGGVSLAGVGIGSTTLTVTMENGFSASCTVTVSQATELNLDEAAEVTMEADTTRFFTFTATEVGVYTFKTPIVDDSYAHMSYRLIEGGSLEELNSYRSNQYYYRHYRLGAGTKITMYLENNRSEAMATSMTVQKGVEATGIAFTSNTVTGKFGNITNAYLMCLPEGAYAEGYPQYITEDGSVAYLNWFSGFESQVYLVNEGNTTLTATLGSFAATTTVVVTGNPELELGVSYNTSFESGEGMSLDFTAPETGIYMFYTPNYYVPELGGVYHNDMTQENNDPRIQFLGVRSLDSGWYRYYSMEAGSEMTMWFYNPNPVSMAAALTVTKAPTPTALYFRESQTEGNEGDLLSFSVSYEPAAAYVAIDFTLSDSAVAQIVEQGDTWCTVRLLQAGTVTLTASCGSMSASQTLTVTAPLYVTEAQPVTVELGNNEDAYIRFRFPESGIYAFRAEGSHGDFYLSDNGLISGENYAWYTSKWADYNVEYMLVSADAGSVLNVQVHAWSSGTFTLSVMETTEPTGLSLNRNELRGTVGFTGSIGASFAPDHAWGELSWSIQDPTVATIAYINTGSVNVEFLKAGQTEITVTCGSLSATVPVISQDPVYLREDTQTQITLDSGKETTVLFTAPETGVYVFHVPMTQIEDGESYFWMYCEGSDGMYADNGWKTSRLGFVRNVYIEEGVTVRLSVCNESWATMTAPVVVARPCEPTKLVLDQEEIRGTAGLMGSVGYWFEPFNAQAGEVTWTVKNTDVATVSGYGSEYCTLNLLEVGQTELTATCGDLSVTVPVIVEAPIELKLNEEYTVQNMSSYKAFTFTAPETGIYGFKTPLIIVEGEAGETWGDYCSIEPNSLPETGEFLEQYVYDGYAVQYVSLEKDTTAELVLVWYNDGAVDTAITAVKATTPTEVYFDTDNLILQPGDEVSLRLHLEGEYAYAPIQWSCDREGLEWWASYRSRNEVNIIAHALGTWVITANVNGTAHTLTVNVMEKLDPPDYGDEESVAEVIKPDGTTTYETLAEALENVAGGYIRLLGSFIEDITVTADTWLDVNGYTIEGNVTIQEGATLYAFDTATADYDAQDMGGIIGKITGNLARSLNTPKALYGHNYKYMAVEWMPGAWTFHRYYLTVKSVILAPCVEEEDGFSTEVNYRTVFKTNEAVLDYITAHGAKFVGEETVYANYFTGGIELIGGGQENNHVVGLGGTMKTANTAAENLANSLLTPTVSAYITLSDGTVLESAPVSRSLQQMAAYANDLTDLSNRQKEALGKMYDLFKPAMDGFRVDISNIKAYAAEYWGTDTAVAFTILSQPESVTAYMDAPAKFAVMASGEGLTYRWQYSTNGGGKWTNSSSATQGYNTSELTVVAATKRDGFMYRCVITDANGNKLTSEAVTLTVNTKLTLLSQPQSVTAAADSNAVFTVKANGEGLTYQWQYSTNGGSKWTNSSSATQGYNTSELTVVAATKRDGFMYRCVITDANGNKLTSEAATLTVQ